jgi:hypothetical protein
MPGGSDARHCFNFLFTINICYTILSIKNYSKSTTTVIFSVFLYLCFKKMYNYFRIYGTSCTPVSSDPNMCGEIKDVVQCFIYPSYNKRYACVSIVCLFV